MTTKGPFVATFRRPNDVDAGHLISIELGKSDTRLTIDDRELGRWPNSEIELSENPFSLTIVGEVWLLDMENPHQFLRFARKRFTLGGNEGTLAARSRVRRWLADPIAAVGSLVRAPRAMGWAAVSVVSLLASLAVDGLWQTIAAVASGALGIIAVGQLQTSARPRPRAESPQIPHADAEARAARLVARALSARSVTVTTDLGAADLTLVKGIGPQYAQLLADSGIRSLEDLANLSPVQKATIERSLGNASERLVRERWVEQARKIVETRRSSRAFR